MGKRTSHAPGTFSWVDLGTTDLGAAKAFYGALFGWSFEDNPVAGAGVYCIASVDRSTVCGLYERSDEHGPPAWLSYITVESTEEAALAAGKLGGSIVAPSFDVTDAGRMALLADPQGAPFAVWQPKGSIGAQLVNDPGALCLNQLNTTDPDAAQKFYSELFGWRVEYNGSDAGDYWGLYNGETLNGGLMQLPPGTEAPPHWLAYFTVTDLNGSVAQIGDLGGRVLVDPMEIEAGQIAVAADPQGAVFALFEGEVDP
ncbi:MAG: VOC family protein [Solirubrobacterales bacterium]